MGTILFALLWLLGDHQSPNDYQVVPVLVSLDSIAIMLLAIMWRMGKCRKDEQPSD